MSVTPFDNSTSTPPGDDKPALKPIDKLRASVRTKVMATTGVDQSGASATERKKKRRMRCVPRRCCGLRPSPAA